MTIADLKKLLINIPDHALVYLHSPVQGDCENVVTAPGNIFFIDERLPGLIVSR